MEAAEEEVDERKIRKHYDSAFNIYQSALQSAQLNAADQSDISCMIEGVVESATKLAQAFADGGDLREATHICKMGRTALRKFVPDMEALEGSLQSLSEMVASLERKAIASK